jgi:hypothetical protein
MTNNGAQYKLADRCMHFQRVILNLIALHYFLSPRGRTLGRGGNFVPKIKALNKPQEVGLQH